MYKSWRDQSGYQVAGREEEQIGDEVSGLEERARDQSQVTAKAVVREVDSGQSRVVAYPWVCCGCGSHMRHGDVCAFCGSWGRRVVRRQGSVAHRADRGPFVGYGRTAERGR